MKTLFVLAFVVAVTMWSMTRADDNDEPQCDHIGYSPFTIRQEICGSNGETYSNVKHLEFENCLYKRAIKKVKDGWCKEEDQRRAEAQQKKLADEQAKRIQHQTGRRA